MITNSLREFIDSVIDKGLMNEQDISFLREEVFIGGLSSRAEADALIALDRLVAVPDGRGNFLVRPILGFAIRQSAVTGALPADFVNWLISSLDVGQPTERAIRIAAAVVREAHCADEYLRRLARIPIQSSHSGDAEAIAA